MGAEGEEWSYETEASFVYSEDSEAWQLNAGTDIIMPGYRGDETVGVSTTPAERGRIMDDNGTALVYNRDVITVGIDKSQFGEGEDPGDAARELAEIAGIDAEDYVARVEAYGDEAFVDAITVRADSEDLAAADIEHIEGVHIVHGERSLPPSNDFAPLLLGRVSPVTAEHLEEDPTLNDGDMVGTSGMQATHDQRLRGTAGVSILVGEETVFSSSPEPGEDLETTMNPRMQDLAQASWTTRTSPPPSWRSGPPTAGSSPRPATTRRTARWRTPPSPPMPPAPPSRWSLRWRCSATG